MKDIYFEVMTGTSSCLAITDGDGSGIRVCGGKQYGGGETKYKWLISKSSAKDILNNIYSAFPEFKPSQPEN